MKFLFDQNISHRILKLLPDFYSDSESVKDLGLINATDLEIWEYARDHNCNIITQDSDFNELNSLRGFPPKVIWIRMGNLKTSDIAEVLTQHCSEIEYFVNDKSYGCFEIFRLNS
jgi:predicted nuclease of predicted toxin-antitoxin system